MSYDDVASAVLFSRRQIGLESRRHEEEMALSVWLVHNRAGPLLGKRGSKKAKQGKGKKEKSHNGGGERYRLRGGIV